MSGYKPGDIYTGKEKLVPLEGDKIARTLWIKVWDLLVSLGENDYFSKGTIVKLYYDDNSICPQFIGGWINPWYCHFSKFAKLPGEKKETIIEKIFKKKHTYETYFKRDDGVVFHKDMIDWTPIKDMEEKEQEYYTKARAIRAKLNAHKKLSF